MNADNRENPKKKTKQKIIIIIKRFWHVLTSSSWQAISDLKCVITLSYVKSCNYVNTHTKVTLHLKLRIWLKTKKTKQKTICLYLMDSPTFSQAQWESKKTKESVDVLPECSTSYLRMDTSCLLLKYINSVLILHLQLGKQSHLHISHSKFHSESLKLNIFIYL